MSNELDVPAMIAKEALALCGTDFRLHGRDADHGLDCIGLAQLCFDAADLSCDVPAGYSIRGGDIDLIMQAMKEAGFGVLDKDEPRLEGDIVVVRPGPTQLHFMIRAGEGFVHAHAGLGRVVHSPGPSQWPVLASFRLLEN